MAAGFVKVAADLDSNPKIRRAGRAGREVFLFVLRRTNLQERDGRCSLANVEPWYLADQLMMPEAEASEGVQRAVAAGLLAIDDGQVAVCGWDDEWAKRPAEGAERTERWRNKRRSEQAAKETAVTATDGEVCAEEESPPVTVVTSPIVTQRHGDESDGSDQIRLDQIRVDRWESAPAAPTDIATGGAVAVSRERRKAGPARARRALPMPAAWAPRGDELALAETLGVLASSEAESFKDHHVAKGSHFVDWDAAFRTWLRNAVKFGRTSAAGRPSFFDIIDSLPATGAAAEAQR